MRRVVTTRTGGASAAPYESFNLGDHVGDSVASVTANRRRLAAGLGLPASNVVWMEQIHSRTVTVVDGPRSEPVPASDAIVTAAPGLALAVLTADCVPILLADAEAGVIAAVHAGRIGARAGIVDAALDSMVGLGARPAAITALLGPSACGACYEVPDAMARDVVAHLPGSAHRTRRGTSGLDIAAGVQQALERAGVVVDRDPRCTIEDASLFSYRRSGRTGRIASVIWTEPESQ